MKKNLLEFTYEQLRESLKNIVDKDYRINQIFEWLYAKKEGDISKWTNLNADIRKKIAQDFRARNLTIVKKEESIIDGTIRYTFKTADKKFFFAVLLANKDKQSVCISCQIGCPMGCNFCSSGRVEFARNLTRGEIVEQVLQIENDTAKKVSGILFMGMGEPMLNFNNVTAAIKSFISKKEFALGKRHITLSTVGNVRAIKKLAQEDIDIRLALSLHATDDRTRKILIPNNFGFKIDDILSAGEYYLKKSNSRLTIEFILIENINNAASDAHKLARLLKKYNLVNPNVQVNIIAFNPIKNTEFKTPSPESIDKFKMILNLSGIVANIRQPKGVDIGAACGQLGY
ncbi:MAG: 23S rRNA (adenine(2503)-C(2))-methyltransferase RlmN [Elusimicrobiota bacterium]|jgi:23S rRNA (adenine2503-C2)-methyltransferase|nr:23S rRNA (adenine(2503)-C(2))-methyltransferase RlmN [Elusimicrobiota bacterium]